MSRRTLTVHSLCVVFFSTFGVFDVAGALARGLDVKHQLTRLTRWTYWISLLVASFPSSTPPSCVSAALALNMHVTAAYWTFLAHAADFEGKWTPRDLIVNGGVLGFLVIAIRTRTLVKPGSPSASAFLTAMFLFINFFAQCKCCEVCRSEISRETPFWKAIVVPATGAIVAASCSAWRAR